MDVLFPFSFEMSDLSFIYLFICFLDIADGTFTNVNPFLAAPSAQELVFQQTDEGMSFLCSSLCFSASCLCAEVSQAAVEQHLGVFGGKGWRNRKDEGRTEMHLSLFSSTVQRKHTKCEAYHSASGWIWASSPRAGKWPRNKWAALTARCQFRWENWWCPRTEGRWLRTGCRRSRWRGRTRWAVGTRTAAFGWKSFSSSDSHSFLMFWKENGFWEESRTHIPLINL